MNSIAERVHAQARINPIKMENRVKTITKLEDGSLDVEFNSGKRINVSKEDELIQVFLVYTVLAGC